MRLETAALDVSDLTGNILNELQSGFQLVHDVEAAIQEVEARRAEVRRAPRKTDATFYQCQDEVNDGVSTLLSHARGYMGVDKNNRGEIG